jgi:hypothetical protein
MKRIFVLLSVVAALGGCAQLDSLGITPQQVIQSGLVVARTANCYISAGAAAGSYVQTDTALACRALGGTVPLR